MLEEAI